MERLENAMKKEMTRKEFLKALGFGAVSILGMGSILRLLLSNSNSTQPDNRGRTYGNNAYGK